MGWLAWTGIVVGSLLGLYYLGVFILLRRHDSKKDASGDYGLALVGLLILPFAPFLMLYEWWSNRK